MTAWIRIKRKEEGQEAPDPTKAGRREEDAQEGQEKQEGLFFPVFLICP